VVGDSPGFRTVGAAWRRGVDISFGGPTADGEVTIGTAGAGGFVGWAAGASIGDVTTGGAGRVGNHGDRSGPPVEYDEATLGASPAASETEHDVTGRFG